jgi:hypothetical protein
MRRVEAILAVAMAISLSGCVVGGKPKVVSAAPLPPKPVSAPTPVAPPEPLSVPQTHVELPPLQPLSADAVLSTQAPDETPNPTGTSSPPTRPSRPRSNQSAGSQRPEIIGPPAPPATPPQPAESERQPIQDIVPAAELNRLRTEATKNREEIHQRLQQLGRRRLSPKDQDLKDRALSLAKLSDQAQRQGDILKAKELAAKGLVLAKSLFDGK